VPQLLVGFGGLLIAVALFLWADGSAWGLSIAWLVGTWGATLVAWGLLAGWYRSLAACLVGSVFALAAMLVALLCVPDPRWEPGILCAIASGLALIFGVPQIWYLSRRRRS
jgi:hypothetical protein